MTEYRIQFWARYYGVQIVTVLVKPGNSAHEVARGAISCALWGYRQQWPGIVKADLHLCSIFKI